MKLLKVLCLSAVCAALVGSVLFSAQERPLRRSVMAVFVFFLLLLVVVFGDYGLDFAVKWEERQLIDKMKRSNRFVLWNELSGWLLRNPSGTLILTETNLPGSLWWTNKTHFEMPTFIEMIVDQNFILIVREMLSMRKCFRNLLESLLFA